MSSPLTGEAWITSSRKRLFDLAVVTGTLPVSVPVVTLGALAFFAETGVNPLFMQMRQGETGEPMRILKLRTMAFSGDYNDGSNGCHDPRASRVGKFLRKFAIDEIPQAASIFSGKMSVVGPRPLISTDVEKTLDCLTPHEQTAWLAARSISRPGWLSTFGNLSRGIDPQSEIYFQTRAHHDIEYVQEASHVTDIGIMHGALAAMKRTASPVEISAP